MTPQHGDRDHAAWSASASARNWACPGSLRACAAIEVDKESRAAAWGTACHQLSEKCLRTSKDAADFIGTEEQTKEHTIDVDDELAETAQVYIDYVRGLQQTADWCKLEEKFSLDALSPPFEAGGTADTTVYFSDLKLLEVVDLKGGRGVMVEVTENKQLRTYALGALLAHPGLDVDKVQVTIVQPRIPHKDGRIRSEIFHVADLMDWTGDLLDAMAKAAAPDAPLVAGPHCISSFCKAAGNCPALADRALHEARVWFDDQDKAQTFSTPESLKIEDLARVLDNADMIEGWINAVRAYAHAQAETGVEVPNYVLVPKQARRKWKEGADVPGALDMVGLTEEQIYAERKLRTPAQIEKTLGKDGKKAIDGLWSAESSGTNLVRADKTTRKAVAPSVKQHFDVLD